MYTEPVLQELLSSACRSIQYRTRTEILGQSPENPDLIELQGTILHDPDVQKVISWQQPDGWLGLDFHGANSLETGMRILREKGVSDQNPVVRRALQALESHPDRLEHGIGKAGRILDELGFGGTQMIQATVCTYAGREDLLSVQAQITEALRGFEAILEVDSINGIVEQYNGRLVFKPGIRWPGIYHLRLLAFTQKWRTPKNKAMLAAAVKRLVDLSPIPAIYVRRKPRWVAPASFCMHNFNHAMKSMDDTEWMKWFHRTECLARLGVIREVQELQVQAEWLKGFLESGRGWFTKQLSHPYFTQWGAYTGLRLEPDWRKPKSREYDLSFRSMLILHYYES